MRLILFMFSVVKGIALALSLYFVSGIEHNSYANTNLTACYGNFPPFAFADEKGIARGAVVELTRSFISLIDEDASVEFYVVPFARCLQMLENGQADITPMLAFTEERADFVSFTDIYDFTSVVIVSPHEELSEVTTFSNIPKGQYRLLKPRGTIIWRELSQQIESGRFFEVVYPVDHIQALDLMNAKRGDLLFIEKHNAHFLLSEKPELNLSIGKSPFYSLPLHFGISKRANWHSQFDVANETIPKLLDSPQFEEYKRTLASISQRNP